MPCSPAWLRLIYLCHAAFSFGLIFDPKDDGDISYEIPVDFQRITRRYIPEDRTLHNHRCENPISYKVVGC
jgi:hypothetical protein